MRGFAWAMAQIIIGKKRDEVNQVSDKVHSIAIRKLSSCQLTYHEWKRT